MAVPAFHRPGRSPRRSVSPYSRAGRTVALGLFLGLAGGFLALAGIALVDRAGLQGPNFGSSVPPELVPVARRALSPLEGGPRWETVAIVGTPWGTAARLRPFVDGVEVRGTDCVVYEETGGLPPWNLESDPSSIDWPGLEKSVRAWKGWALAGPGASKADPLSARLLGGIAASLRQSSAASTAAGGPSTSRAEDTGKSTEGDPLQAHPFIRLLTSGERPWSYEAELTLSDPDLAVNLRTLLTGGRPAASADEPGTAPEQGRPAGASQGQSAAPQATEGRKPPAVPGALDYDSAPVDLRVTLDPHTFALSEVRDTRFFQSRAPIAHHGAAAGAGLSGSAATGWGLLFDPNPVVVSGDRSLRLGDPVDEYRVWVKLPRLDGSGYLHGSFIETTTDRPPAAHEEGLLFSYPSISPNFGEGMAYFHGDRALQRADSLGFTGLFKTPLRIRVHGTALDNSWYSRPRREVVLGDGGVEDAQDADIILHEVGHAIHDAFVPGFGDGATAAISEGFGDFWAASLTDDACIGDWDATAYSPPCLRVADSPAVYPASLTGRVHEDGAIWSGTLWELRGILGPARAERLALAAFLEQGTSSSYPEAGRGVLAAAERIGLEADMPSIRAVLARRGLMPMEFDFDLAREEERVLDLIAPGTFLGGTVTELILCGDGKIFLSSERRAKPHPQFPGGPAAAFACASLEDDGSLSLRVRGTVNGGGARIEQEWSRGTQTLARAEIRWNAEGGDLEWTYLDLSGIEGGRFAAGAAREAAAADSLAAFPLAEVTSDGLGNLPGFWGLFSPEMARQVPLRYRILPEDKSGGFRLRQEPVFSGPAGTTAAAQPNPFRQTTTLRFYQKAGGRTRVQVFDLAGRRIRLLHDGPLPSGIHLLDWDGRDERGRQVPAGLYWARLEGSGQRQGVRILRLR